MLNAHIGYVLVFVIEGPVPKTLLERSDEVGSVAIYLNHPKNAPVHF